MSTSEPDFKLKVVKSILAVRGEAELLARRLLLSGTAPSGHCTVKFDGPQ